MTFEEIKTKHPEYAFYKNIDGYYVAVGNKLHPNPGRGTYCYKSLKEIDFYIEKNSITSFPDYRAILDRPRPSLS